MNDYIIVRGSDKEYVDVIHNILKQCGLNMAKQLLFHWLPFYPKKNIQKDCEDNIVVLVYDKTINDYTSTFQMLVKNNDLYVRKIATLPMYEGRGIGKTNMNYMEEFAKKMNCTKIILDVYIRSKHAINFYLKNGFVVEGQRRSIRFKELIMVKNI